MTAKQNDRSDGVALIEAMDLAVSLTDKPVVRGVNFTARSGRITAVIGPNGAGKSTLLRALSGLIGHDSGTVLLGGRNLDDMPSIDIARTLAYLPQERHVHWPMSVHNVVALGRLPHTTLGAGESADDEAAISSAMLAMDVAQMSRRPISQLSGGERARVLVARALAQETSILLADEPTAGLDPAHQLVLFEQFKSMTQEGRCIVVALHDLSLAARYCDDVLLMCDGVGLAQGPAAQVLTPQLLARAYGIEVKVETIGSIPVVLPVDILRL